MKKYHKYLTLFITFFKIGAFTFGGGWAMISVIEREVVARKKWLTGEEFLDALAIAQSMPGILAVNISILVGNRTAGIKGSIVATLGSILPSFVIILLIATFFKELYQYPAVEAIFKGIRPVVVGLIAVPLYSAIKSAKLRLSSFWIPIVVALGIWLYKVNPVWFVVLGIVGGIVGILYQKRNKK